MVMVTRIGQIGKHDFHRTRIALHESEAKRMGRVEKRMYKRARGQVLLRRILLGLTVLVAAMGLISRARGRDSIIAQPLADPTATPIASAFDETVETREITLGEEVWYTIQTGIFSTREAAEEKAGAYTDRGAPGYVLKDGDKYRVLIACYGQKEDASAVRARLSDQQNVETYLYEWTTPKLSLRLTGMAGQLDVVEAGMTLLTQSAALLRDEAALLDVGEITLTEAKGLIAQIGEQITLWQETTRQRFSKPYPSLVEMEMALADGWSASRTALDRAAADSATALSAEMKLQAMGLYQQGAALRDALESE